VSPTPDLFQNYNAARDTYLSDGQLGVMALEAWRSHVRTMHEYLPDRDMLEQCSANRLQEAADRSKPVGRKCGGVQAREIRLDLPEVSHPGRSLLPERSNAIRGTEGYERIIQKEVLPAQQVLRGFERSVATVQRISNPRRHCCTTDTQHCTSILDTVYSSYNIYLLFYNRKEV
jgi:hypothetical protein